MTRFSLILLVTVALSAVPMALAQAQPAATPSRAVDTASLVDLCAVPANDPNRAMAEGYCRGFMVGAGQYHVGATGAPGGAPPIFCLPTPSPTLESAQAAFVAWGRANTQYGSERAVDGLLRWASTAYPCPTPPPAPARRAANR